MGNGYPAAAFGGTRGGHERAARQGQPRRHVRRQPGGRRGGGQDARDPPRHRRPRDDPGPPAQRIQAGLREVLDPTRPALPLHRPPLDVRDHVPRGGRRPSTATGPTTDHELYDAVAVGMHARGAMPEPDSREPWFVCEAHAKGDIVDRVVSIFADSLDAALETRAQGRSCRVDRSRTAARRRPSPTARRCRRGPRWSLDGNAVRSVDRAAALLLALGDSQGEAGVTELARRLGLHKSTASRLLATLQKRGLVEQDDETGKYRLGLVVIRLAEQAERTLDLRGIALPELERLARLTHETTGLGQPRRRPAPDGRPGRRPEPHRRRRLDRAGDAAPLRGLGQGAHVRPGRARGRCASSGAACRATPSGRSSSSSRCSRSWPGSGGAATRRRSASTRSGSTRWRRRSTTPAGNVIAAVDIWGPAFRLTPATHPRAGGPGARVGRRDLGPPRRHDRLNQVRARPGRPGPRAPGARLARRRATQCRTTPACRDGGPRRARTRVAATPASRRSRIAPPASHRLVPCRI